jgi:hypothetical protein
MSNPDEKALVYPTMGWPVFEWTEKWDVVGSRARERGKELEEV